MDVARRAGVSISSVSRATNAYPGVHPKLKTRVERAIADLDYLPSGGKKRLQPTRSRLICFILANRNLHIPFHARVLQSIENECTRHGDVVLFRTLRYSPQATADELKVQDLLGYSLSEKKKLQADGVILSGKT